MHPTAFEPRFDDKFVGTFDTTAANRPTGRLESWILHERFTLFEVGQGFAHTRRIGVGDLQGAQVAQHPYGTVMLEPMELRLEPVRRWALTIA